MASTLTIGDFARATHLSVKALRHYHEAGLLEPIEVDRENGYRRYALEQIATAQIIRRFRELSMPLETIRAVLAAPDVGVRNGLIAVHLDRLEQRLSETQHAVAALRDLLQPPEGSIAVHHRSVPRTRAAAITAAIDIADAGVWMQGALGELYAMLRTQRVAPSGAAGGFFAGDLFADEYGDATIFVPCDDVGRAVGRVIALDVPAVELATVIHVGGHENIDRGYGVLAAYVTQHALAVSGPIREYYLVGPQDTSEADHWRTEIGWPIFRTLPPT
jgi:DNA-binding transcriptional MerR regulator/effector-binding domain-containing protein